MAKLKQIKKNVSLSEQAYKTIKDAIIENELKPGDVLAEEFLAEQLKISRTPIRSALKQLVVEGLAEVNENKNVVVSDITDEDIMKIDTLRCALEPLAITILEKTMTKEDLEELKEIYQMQMAEQDHQNFLEYDYEFHVKIAEMTQNNYLQEVVEKLNLIYRRYHVLSGVLGKFSDVALEEHKQIIDHLEKRNFEKAKELMEQHVKYVGIRILTGREENSQIKEIG